MVYAQSIKYPYTSARDLFIAFVLFTVPILNLFSGFFVYGYLVHAAQGVRKNQQNLPQFTGAAHLFVDGLKAMFIVLIYAIPALLSLVLLLVNRNAAVALASILGALAAFMLPTALLAFSREESIKSAVNMSHVFKTSFSSHMIFAWLVSIVVAIAYLAAGIVLAFFTQIIYIGLWLSMGLAIMLILFTVTPLFVHAYEQKMKNSRLLRA